MIGQQRTKKIRTAVNRKSARQLLDSFGTLVGEKDEKEKPLECVYQNPGERESCSICEAQLAFTDEGFLACTNKNCGVIFRDVLDHSAEWRNYGESASDPTRCGMPVNPLLQQSSFGCRVVCQSSSSYEMRKIRRYTDWQAMPYSEKAQYDEFIRITALASEAGIAKMIIDDALRYHKKVSQHQTFRGLNRDGIIAASIYVSCRINAFPRTAKEIAAIFKLDVASATKGCKNAVTIINEIEEDTPSDECTSFARTTAVSFIARFCSRLAISANLTKLCQFVAVKLDKNNWVPENTPHAKAAGVVYFVSSVCGTTRTKQEVHRVSDISEVTINKCYKKLMLLKDKLIPSQFLQQS